MYCSKCKKQLWLLNPHSLSRKLALGCTYCNVVIVTKTSGLNFREITTPQPRTMTELESDLIKFQRRNKIEI